MDDAFGCRYDESVFDNPELPESNDQDFQWDPIPVETPAREDRLGPNDANVNTINEDAQKSHVTLIKFDVVDCQHGNKSSK
jgi:hypothetical protein